ncbi:MAG: 4Fe-4S binding protein, partial [Bacteroidota bacterium]|nr:4Fe-4S binding protein [Bacteroidota bacterium]
AAIARARESEALTSMKIPATNAVAVIGAGIGGMRTAIGLADMGTEVYLIEKSFFVGGHTSQWGNVAPNDDRGNELINSLYKEIQKRANIKLFTGAELIEKTGSIGNFDIKVKISSRGFSGFATDADINRAVSECPISLDDEYNFGLIKRKAIYLPDNGQYPLQPAIDMKACIKCGLCNKICSSFNPDGKEEILSLHIGGFVVNTGFDSYEPLYDEYGYNKIENVITLPQFKRLIELNEHELLFKGEKVKKIAYIYCVGSRQDKDGENKYCSRYCCTATSHTAVLVKNKFKNIQNIHFTRGIRTYGKQELIYAQASEQGDIFLQFTLDNIPQVEKKGNRTYVKVKDILTAGKTLETDADLIVLVTGMVPRKNDKLEHLLKIPVGRDHFFNEIHMKLKPVETVIDGVVIGGTCQSPKNIYETLNSSMAASAKINSILTKGELVLEPTLAKINPAACIWCNKCTEACPFDAISQIDYEDRKVAKVIESNCKGCGMCTPVCPSDAIDLYGYTNPQIESMIDALSES